MSISDVVNVSITRETQTLSQAGFGTINILGSNLNGSRIEYFNTDDLTALSAKLIGGTAALEYVAAQAIAAQSPRPVRFAVSQRSGIKHVIFTGTLTGGTIGVVANGTLVTQVFTTDRATTMAALAVSIQALPTVLTCTYNDGTGQMTLTPESGAASSMVPNLTSIVGTLTYTQLVGTISEAHNTSLNAVKVEDNDWYGLIIISRVASECQTVAAWVEANEKVFITASAVANVVDTTKAADTTTIAALLNPYARSFGIYHPDAATAFPDAGMLSVYLARVPGSYTGMFKKINGTIKTTLTPTQAKNALDKNFNTYENIGGKDMIRKSTAGDGEFFDVIHFCDWFKARMTEGVFGLLARSEKVPFDAIGGVAIKSVMDSVGQQGIDSLGFTKNKFDEETGLQIGGYYTIMPDFDTISTNDKAARSLNGVKFTGFLAGAIHAVTINGTITL
jgi:hypothetical protein